MTAEPEWVEFDALVEVLVWGRNVDTVIRATDALEGAAKELRTRRVEGVIDEVPVKVGLNRADVLAHAGPSTPAPRRPGPFPPG